MPATRTRALTTPTWLGVALPALLVTFTLASPTGCKLLGGDDDAETDTPAVDPAAERGQRAFTFHFDDAPRLGAPVRITLDAPGALSETAWRLASAPPASTASLTIADDGRAATLTPDAAGAYAIALTAALDGAAASGETRFDVRPELPYDPAQVERDDPDAPLETIIGRVRDQAWVFSIEGSEADLRAAVAGHPSLTILGYDSIEGLLVRFDPDSAEAPSALASLRTTAGIDSVAQRVHQGVDAPRFERVPDDGSSFSDGGDNWHLEHIHAPAAWDVTTGAPSLRIGVCDAGFDAEHEDLRGRFAEVLTWWSDDHGNGVAGAIAALTDNRLGMSGINWESRIIAGLPRHLHAVAAKARIVSSSWSMAGHIPKTFDPGDDAIARRRRDDAIAYTRSYRNAALRAFKDTLFVFSGGNGIGNGAGHAGTFGVPSHYNNGAVQLGHDERLLPLDNIIVVAAMVRDGRLAFYSQYGDTVDIAAPTHYKSAGVGPATYQTSASYGAQLPEGAFSGTSAAAPVVSGVASLVMSVDPELSASDVKIILIETATRRVTERYTDPYGGTAPIDPPLPVVDAKAAVDAARRPTLSIEVDPPSGLRPGDQAYFRAELEHGLGPFIYTWDFGDGGTSALANDTHAFLTGGVYTVTLTVVDRLDREARAEIQVSVAQGDVTGPDDGNGSGDQGDYVIWYTDNVGCWGAPLIYITHRDTYELEELASSFPGGGVDPNTLVEKRLFSDAGYPSVETARAWICPQITGFYYHYWCGTHYLIGDRPFQVGRLGCDLGGVPEVPYPE